MKLKDILNELFVNEIGDTTRGYNWKLEDSRISKGVDGLRVAYRYRFRTENFTYDIAFYKPDNSQWVQVDFDTLEKGQEETNEGNQFRVVATILDAAKDFKRKMDKEDVIIKGFQFDAISKSINQDLSVKSQREKLYTAFIKRQFPSARVKRTKHGTVFVDL